jgi:hypothetical protein
MMNDMIKCTKCRKGKTVVEYTDPTNGKQFAKCNECRKKAKDWRDKNAERVKEYNKLVRETRQNEKKTKNVIYGKQITDDDSKWIKYESQHDVVDKLGIDKSNISKVISGKIKSTKGYIFKIVEEKNEKKDLQKWEDIVEEKFQPEQTVSQNIKLHKLIDGVAHKKCSACQKFKQLIEFNRDIKNKDGFRSNCKSCQKKDREKSKPDKNDNIKDEQIEKKQEDLLIPKKKKKDEQFEKKQKDSLIPKIGNIDKKDTTKQQKRGGGKKKSYKIENNIKKKHCPTCDKWKIFDQFNKQSSSHDNLARMCRDCIISYRQKKRKNEQKYKDYDSTYNEKYKKSGRRAEVNKIWYDKNRERIIKKMVEYHKKRYHSNPTYRLLILCRTRFNKILSNQSVKKSKSFKDLVGKDPDELRTYIESKFKKGMTWENIHIDHIIPCSTFDMKNEEEQQKCFHWSNLQPLFAKDNLKKGNKLNYIVLYEDVVKEVLDEIIEEDKKEQDKLMPKKKSIKKEIDLKSSEKPKKEKKEKKKKKSPTPIIDLDLDDI